MSGSPWRGEDSEHTLVRRLQALNWGVLLLIFLVASIGFAMLYSAASGQFEPWAIRQMVRFGFSLALVLVLALAPIQFWMRAAYPVYGVALLLLLLVEVFGDIGMGAQRWIDVGLFRVQPSELMKPALVLALALYFHGLTLEDIGRPTALIAPVLLVAVPSALVLRQPDLGTAVMLITGGAVMFFLAGVRLWKFIVVLVGGVAALPVLWSVLRSYQKQRILTFLNPESDPLGAGYHIIQSKIAIGAAGVFGRGFMNGPQSQLNFLPEKHTDFIFAMLVEEAGLFGGFALMILYILIIVYGLTIALKCRNQFGRLMAMGTITFFSLYVLINIAMVTGVVPVVGVPLPLVSYGGTSMLAAMLGFGLLMNVHLHSETRLPRLWSAGGR